ncbi:hypothetical protein K505DRAFT_157786 [Melanomma pulvis-pyrius CBS 109.77]|uniref:Uncharacterized protein n=1 Tax=Melanomma pulvis-pyrius CBS 109.77 TaxID=1314802 RepID=A0A6A6WPT4_9PLEO|nr:hypothetical protein K505DRAFT_157786 [Melanomma pulvis-pyrius CBS 109.77]
MARSTAELTVFARVKSFPISTPFTSSFFLIYLGGSSLACFARWYICSQSSMHCVALRMEKRSIKSPESIFWFQREALSIPSSGGQLMYKYGRAFLPIS